ncbi:MAG: DUF488 domain-containing protein [Okeania sp. SIO2G4]|uniref:DUF488 domain-containing protein n=1 Tax=unclassified Okeania TaxID=2634635 RepID=UPI0013BC5D09|nr:MULTISPECIES: DUF488 domain-containing protein [unclassified Okeania]NEP44869.1 DUF488 domain-containing protein [Okeania sp. SIO2H7]NEP73016.1 DUF488 domain-containing protein [Okeania sp. SIO2G5]NEP93780.1 DUF488 domain-containing protein [Okeania sp. SIO2F5]NEQ91655.1 DUF488 domain-containing protein [Okeania sp. SIO2G4]
MNISEKFSNKYILTFGYGNRKDYTEFLEYLQNFDVKCVIDVRKSPRAWSRKWYGDKIENLCHSKNIQYISKVSLGNTSGKANWVSPTPEKVDADLSEIAEIVTQGNILLLCAELDPARCHRVEVANCLNKLISAQVKHLK